MMCDSVLPTVFECDEEVGGQSQIVDMLTQVVSNEWLSRYGSRETPGTDVFYAEDEECTIEFSLQHTERQLVYIHTIVSLKDDCSVPARVVKDLLSQVRRSVYWDPQCSHSSPRTRKQLQIYIQQIPDRVESAVGSSAASKLTRLDYEMQELASQKQKLTTFDRALDDAVELETASA